MHFSASTRSVMHASALKIDRAGTPRRGVKAKMKIDSKNACTLVHGLTIVNRLTIVNPCTKVQAFFESMGLQPLDFISMYFIQVFFESTLVDRLTLVNRKMMDANQPEHSSG